MSENTPTESTVEKQSPSEAASKRSEYNREYRLKHAAELAAYNKQWKKANPDRVRAKQKRYFKKNRERILAKGRDRWHEKFGPSKRVFGRSEEEKLELRKTQQRNNYLEHREARRAYAKKKREENPEESRKKCRDRYAAMTLVERRAEQQAARARRLAKDPDCDKRRKRERYKNDPEYRAKTLASAKKWIADNPEHWRQIARDARRKLIQNDPCFKIRCLMATRIHQALAGELKHETTMQLLGCSREEFKAHLESKFQPGMAWENLGSGAGAWQIDHITPIDQYDLSTIEGQRAAFFYLNTQPLWYEDHQRKSATEETGWRRNKKAADVSAAREIQNDQ